MRPLEADDNWEVIKDYLKKTWPILSDEDLHYIRGQEDELVKRIKTCTDESTDKIEQVIKKAMTMGDVC